MRKDEDEIVQVLNPKVNRYMKINKTIGAIIGVKKSSGPYKNILIVEKNKEGGSMKKTNDELELELAQLKDKYQKLEFEIAELKEVMDWQAYFINEITNTEYELTPTISSKEKKKIYCQKQRNNKGNPPHNSLFLSPCGFAVGS